MIPSLDHMIYVLDYNESRNHVVSSSHDKSIKLWDNKNR